MKSTEMLRAIVQEYSESGPMRRVQDAKAILTVLPGLDEEGARVYLDRFMEKWSQPATPEEVAASKFSRRRPMTEFERRVHAHMLAKEAPRELVIEFDADGFDPDAKRPRPPRKPMLPKEPRVLGVALTHVQGLA